MAGGRGRGEMKGLKEKKSNEEVKLIRIGKKSRKREKERTAGRQGVCVRARS